MPLLSSPYKTQVHPDGPRTTSPRVEYPLLRELLSEAHRESSAEEIEEIFRQTFGAIDPDDVEDFLQTIALALPPVPRFAGRLNPPARSSSFGETGKRIMDGCVDAPATRLLQLIFRPESVRAVTALALGEAGAGTVPAGGTQVPAAAIVGLIGELAIRATLSTAPPEEWEREHYAGMATPLAYRESW